MSLTIRELTEEEVKELVNEVLQNPDRYQTEAKLLLKLEIKNRRGGCGYRYLYSTNIEILYGKADEIILSKSEFNCDVAEDIVIIPKTVPTVILERYHDDNPEVNDYVIIHVFTLDGWKSITTKVPK